MTKRSQKMRKETIGVGIVVAMILAIIITIGTFVAAFLISNYNEAVTHEEKISAFHKDSENVLAQLS